MMAARNEVHLVQGDNGHAKSVDCWCEPTNIRWMTNKWGVRVLVVDHEDWTDGVNHPLTPRHLIEAQRTAGFPPQFNWITRVLEGAQDYPSAAHRDIRGRDQKGPNTWD